MPDTPDGLRVVDLATDVAGAFCARLLALTGAEVVGPVRAAAPTAASPLGDGAWRWAYLGAHRAPLARHEIADAIADADVVVTSFDAGRFTQPWDEAAIRARVPSVVHVTTSSFGTTGPYRSLAGAPIVDWAAGGYLFITGIPSRPPLAGPDHLCGYVAGYTAAIAAEAALAHRRAHGTGAHVDVSTMEAMLSVHQSTFSRLAAGIRRVRTGRYTEVHPLVVQPCRNGWVSLGCNTDEEFDRFVVAIGLPALAADARFSDRLARAANADALDAALAPVLEALDAEAIVELLQAARVPSAKVASVAEVLHNPQLAARGFWEQVEVDGVAARMPGNPIPLHRTSSDTPSRPPDHPPPHPASAGGPPPAHLDTHPQARQPSPVAGALVLDFSVFWAGPSATRTLADLGARVVRIERPGSRLDVEELPDDPNVLVQELYFNWKMNRSKRSLVVDLKRSEGLDVVRRLAALADVIVENFRPGVMARLGLDHPTLAATNPGLVTVSLSGFGSEGPWAGWGSYGPTIEAASSIEWRTGYPGGEPLRLGHTLPDGAGGLAGALAALVGLRRRAETGRGAWYDVSQLEAYVAMSGEDVLATAVTGSEAERHANASTVPGRWQTVVACAGDDRWLAVSCDPGDARNRLRALLALGADAGLTDVEAALVRFAATRTPQDAAEALRATGVAAFPVLAPEELVADPHLAARGYFVEAPVEGHTVALPGSAIVASPRLAHPGGVPPRVGEHSRAVVTELLGLSDDTVEDLVDRGILIQGRPRAG